MTEFSLSGDNAISSEAKATMIQNAGSDRNNSSIVIQWFVWLVMRLVQHRDIDVLLLIQV